MSRTVAGSGAGSGAGSRCGGASGGLCLWIPRTDGRPEIVRSLAPG